MKRSVIVLGLVWGACHLETLPDPGLQDDALSSYSLPTEPPPRVKVPLPPPPPRPEIPTPCEDSQAYVPGEWEWLGRWAWAAGYCANAQPGYVYVPPLYQDGTYLRGYFALDPNAAPLAALKPSYRRYIHEDGIEFAPRQPAPAPLSEPEPEPQRPTPIYGYGYPRPRPVPASPGVRRGVRDGKGGRHY